MTAISAANLTGTENGLEKPLSALNGEKSSFGLAKKAEIKKAAIEFQSLFVEMMLKSMRETAKQDKLTGGGHGEEVYSSMLDREYAVEISKRGNLGLAEIVEKQLLEQINNGAKAINTLGSVKTNGGNIEAYHEN